MAAYKLAATAFAPALLFEAALFPVSGYVGSVAMGAFDSYAYLHYSITSLFASTATPLSYFVHHLLIQNATFFPVFLFSPFVSFACL
jgi:hypothetical protein